MCRIYFAYVCVHLCVMYSSVLYYIRIYILSIYIYTYVQACDPEQRGRVTLRYSRLTILEYERVYARARARRPHGGERRVFRATRDTTGHHVCARRSRTTVYNDNVSKFTTTLSLSLSISHPPPGFSLCVRSSQSTIITTTITITTTTTTAMSRGTTA